MKTVLAIAASLLVNASMIVAFDRSALESTPVPSGEVIVTNLSIEVAPTLAQAAIPGRNQLRTL